MAKGTRRPHHARNHSRGDSKARRDLPPVVVPGMVRELYRRLRRKVRSYLGLIFVVCGFRGCGKSIFCCHPERSEGSAFSQIPRKKQIPRAKSALGMTKLEFFRSLFSRDIQGSEEYER